MMTPFVIGNIQFTFSLIVFALIAIWYVAPKLQTLETRKALVCLFSWCTVFVMGR